MKKTKPVLVRKHRAHRVLFENHSPFRARTVENKTRYQRQSKHKERYHDT